MSISFVISEKPYVSESGYTLQEYWCFTLGRIPYFVTKRWGFSQHHLYDGLFEQFVSFGWFSFSWIQDCRTLAVPNEQIKP